MTLKMCTGPGPCDRRGRRKTGLCEVHQAQQAAGKELTPIRAHTPATVYTARDDQGRKQCRTCSSWKDTDAFSKNSRMADQLDSDCKRCKTLAVYGMAQQDYDARLAAQGGQCAACPTQHSDTAPLHVDHDHSCCPEQKSCGDCVRGLLCRSCNLALGLINDSRDTLRGLLRYLG